MSESFDRVVAAAYGAGRKVVEMAEDHVMIQCPTHNDGRPSLSVKKIEGSTLVYCMAGCDTKHVVEDLGLKMGDLFDDKDGYTYVYPGGREVHRTPDKKFFQQGDKTDTSLFRSDRLSGTGPVWVVEGEKDVLAIESVGGQAVSAPNGASAKPDRYNWEPLRGKTIHILADRDEVGRLRANALAEHLRPMALSVTTFEPAEGKDAADHIASGRSLGEFVPTSLPEVLSFSQAVDAWRTWRDSPHAKPIPTPWHQVNDRIAGGLQRGRLYVVGARVGQGKSLFGVNILSHAAERDYCSLVVSVEMPHVEIVSRILAAQAMVPYDHITRLNFGDEDVVKIDRYIAENREIPLHICDKATISIEEVSHKAKLLKDASDLSLAFIDYAQLIKASDKNVSRQEQVAHIARSCKIMAMELDIPVILAAQLNRNAADGQRAPRMEDLRESGELEQSADVIMLLHRDEHAGNSIYVSIPKNRTGRAGNVVLQAAFDQARVDS